MNKKDILLLEFFSKQRYNVQVQQTCLKREKYMTFLFIFIRIFVIYSIDELKQAELETMFSNFYVIRNIIIC